MEVSASIISALTAGGLACIVTLSGIYMMSSFEDWSRDNSTYFCSFAAGALLTVSFLHIVPQSISMSEMAPVCLLMGYMGMHMITRFISGYLCDRYPDKIYAFGLIPMIGIGLHSFIDGVIYAVAFSVSSFTGILACSGLILHEFPEGVVTFVFLRKGGFSRGKAAALAFLAAGLTTPLGTAVSYPFITAIDDSLKGSLLAVSSGVLIYVGATHLLPQTEKEPRRFSSLAMFLGVAIACLIVVSHS